MDTTTLTADDEALVEHAIETCGHTFDPDFFGGTHVVAAAVRTADGAIYDGASLPASTGQASTCRETVAVGSAIVDGASHDEIETCVAVDHPMPYRDGDGIHVVPPCWTCRKTLADYNEAMRVIVPVDDENPIARAVDLLPTRTW